MVVQSFMLLEISHGEFTWDNLLPHTQVIKSKAMQVGIGQKQVKNSMDAE